MKIVIPQLTAEEWMLIRLVRTNRSPEDVNRVLKHLHQKFGGAVLNILVESIRREEQSLIDLKSSLK